METWKNPSRKRLFVIVGVWVALLVFSLISSRFSALDFWETLQGSHFARVMFSDIGVLSTLISGYIVLVHKAVWRIPFAIAILIVGSFALLPYLALLEWLALRSAGSKVPKPSGKSSRAE
jgi:hypothetical protein